MFVKPSPKLLKTKLPFAVALASLAIAMMFLLGGCASQPQIAQDQDQTLTPSEYMVKLNQASGELREQLDGFAQAVSDGDTVTLQSKADAAFKSMESLKDLKVSDELNDVRSKYDQAIEELRNSLNEYIALYSQIEGSSDPSKLDPSKYSKQIEEIQKSYDNAMNLLDQADSAAKEL